ncbi:hypothetical protein O3G_MSEX010018 [Manduca sexta]|uniref:Anoctamin n=1 Tax=Manduca sexta TaxID=7130 RepID=A0A921ZFE8_MANSE|nr:hypothetical protein O3G_MSEX010018 [Manduca sexta]
MDYPKTSFDSIFQICDDRKKSLINLPRVIAAKKVKFLKAIGATDQLDNIDAGNVDDENLPLDDIFWRPIFLHSKMSSVPFDDSIVVNDFKAMKRSKFDLRTYISCVKTLYSRYVGGDTLLYLLCHARDFSSPQNNLFTFSDNGTFEVQTFECLEDFEPSISIECSFTAQLMTLMEDLLLTYDEMKYQQLNLNVTYLLLFMVRKIFKCQSNYVNALKKPKTHQEFVKLCPRPLCTRLPDDPPLLNNEVAPKEDKLFTLILYAYSRSTGLTKRVLVATCIEEMMYTGLGLPMLFDKVKQLYKVTAARLWDALTVYIDSCEAMFTLADFYEMQRKGKDCTPPKTFTLFPYCRVLNGKYHGELSSAFYKNYIACYAMAYLVDKKIGMDKSHMRKAHWVDRIDACWERLMARIRVDPEMFPERKHRLTAIYSKDKEYLFDTNSECFWTPSIRSRIVQFILDRKKFSHQPHDDFAFGITRLISNCTYSAAYPLHDGDLKTPGSMRHLLYTEWAAVSKCLKYQPLDYVKDYFGVKIGLYFAWLGFYTHMLIPASLVGLICVIYSAATVYSNKPSEDICNYTSSIKMCPQCDYFCDYWDLRATCLQSRITYLFDNSTTVFFAIFMSFWAACFLELWKRYSAEMTHRWDLTGFDVYEEHPRPQYLARLAHVKRTQLNVVTGEREPMVPFWRMRLPAALMSFSVVALLVLLALATVLGVVLYRMSLLGAAILRQNNAIITYNPIMFTTATAACINLCFICMFNYIYQYLAEWLTEKELLRTQTEFDDSLTLKIYLLQFVNYYASIFYIAFFKGKLIGRPGGYVRFFGHRQEECAPGGCLLELSIQLAIIMVGKQFINTIVEMMMPYLLKWWYIIRTIGRKKHIKSPLQWVKDFKLVDFGNMGLFPEYLEMVLQYGFVTIFVAAFPLAPLFALINNVLEMRLDAKKFLTCYRRPVPQRVTDIGVWYRILDSIGKLSIITNGFIIAFTSDFIPRLVYQFSKGSLDQYVNHTLADFNITVLEHPPIKTYYNETMCSFPGYWYYKEGENYEHSNWYWHIIGARLAFVVVFENVVALVMIIVRWAIPDMSGELRDRIRREAYVINSFILDETRARSRLSRTPRDARYSAHAHDVASPHSPPSPPGRPSTSTPV